MPKLTIGIPTYNRAHMLPTSLSAALSQTHDDVEVIVSDNASTDNTEEVVRKFGRRVRYYRNETNLGPSANFCRLVELATGDYFSWLQDDDCIFGQFAQRAVNGLESSPQAMLYGAYAAVAPQPNYLANSWLYGPPLALDWTTSTLRLIPGEMIAPLSLCVSVVIPPVCAFRLSALKSCMPRWNHEIPLLVERTIVAEVAALGEAVLDPYVAGVFRAHANQGYKTMQQENPNAMKEQWAQMAKELDALPIRDRSEWRRQLTALISELSLDHRNQWEIESRTWPTDLPICREMRDMLVAKTPPKRIPLSPSGIAKAGARAARDLLSRVLD
jgi:hypothetical protein